MSNKSGFERAVNAAQLANGMKNILKGAMSGGLHGAAAATLKSFAPQIIKIALVAFFALLLLPFIIISALPSVLFGWTSIPSQDLKDQKNHANNMVSCYNQVVIYRQEVIDDIIMEHSRVGDNVTLNDDETHMDINWIIAIDGVKHKQNVNSINENGIKNIIKESLSIESKRDETDTKKVTITITACTPDELMNKLGYNDDEKNWAYLLYNTTTNSQEIPSDSADYINGIDTDYSGITFANGSTSVVYYNQFDSRWVNKPYGRSGTIGEAGCGPTSLAMVVATLTSHKVTPVEVAGWSAANGYRCIGSGSYHALIPKGAQHYGLTVEGAGKNEGQKIVDALSSGKLVIVILNPGHFTKSGHYIVLRGVTAEGKILVADSASYSRSEQEWDLSIILKEARGDAAAGGPFWIIG